MSFSLLLSVLRKTLAAETIVAVAYVPLDVELLALELAEDDADKLAAGETEVPALPPQAVRVTSSTVALVASPVRWAIERTGGRGQVTAPAS